MMDDMEVIRERMRRAGVGPAAKTTEPTQPAWDADLVPDFDEPKYGDDELDIVIKGIGIEQAYLRWCGKSIPNVGNRTESIKVACPRPDHPDTDPSAWINTEKDAWFCGGCQVGGDIYDIAAWHFGYSVPGYKMPGVFPELKKKMAADFGYVVKRTLGGNVTITQSEPAKVEPSPLTAVSAPAQDPPESNDPDVPDTSGIVLIGPGGTVEINKGFDADLVKIKWRETVPAQTFLYEWMAQCGLGDEPNEYLYWLGLLVLGSAIGNNVKLGDDPNVRGNLMVCLVGSSGSRKSRAVDRMHGFMEEYLPYDANEDNSTGTQWIPTPGSGETLVDAFSKPIFDDVNPSVIIGSGSIRGMVKFSELTELTSRTARIGGVLQPTLMSFYDTANRIGLSSRTHGVKSAENHFCQVVTTTQPKAMRELVNRSDVDSGFINRWVFAKAIEKQRRAIGTSTRADLHDAGDLIKQIRSWATPRTIHYTPEGELAAVAAIEKTVFPVQHDEKPINLRLDLTFKKLLLLLTVNERQPYVTKDVVERAEKLLPYLIHTYDVVDGFIGFGAFEDCCDEILQVIEGHTAGGLGRGPTIKQIRASVSKRFNGELLARCLKSLMQVAQIEEVIGAKSVPETYRRTA